MRKKLVGKKRFCGKLDITDPCYDKDVWCRSTVNVKDGEYSCCVWINREKVSYPFNGSSYEVIDNRIGVIGIYLNGVIPKQCSMKRIASIGVDAGLAGFFIDKQDYSNEEWNEFCDSIRGGDYWLRDDCFFSSSGYGDGVYDVYAVFDGNEATAVEIRFL